MAEVVQNAQSINEAVALVHGVDAACGPASAYEAAGAIGGFPLSTRGLQNLVARGVDAGRLTTGGQDIENVGWDLSQYGIGVESIWSASTPAELETILDANLERSKPTIIGAAEGHFLSEEPSSLHGHFVTIVGKNDDNTYVTADPNTVAASHGEFTSNSLEQIFNAQGLGNITPAQGTGRSISIGNTNELSALDSSGLPGINFPSHFTIGFDSAPFQSAVIRIGIGAIGGLIMLISFNNLLGAMGLPDVQSVIKAQLRAAGNIADTTLKVAPFL